MSFRVFYFVFFIWVVILNLRWVSSGVIGVTNDQSEGSGTEEVYVDSNYPMCEDGDDICVKRELHKKARIEQVKRQMLKALNLAAPPNISKNERPSDLTIKSLMQNYGIQKAKREIDREQEGLTVKTIQTIKVAEHNLDYSEGSQFSFIKSDQNLHIKRAHLWFYVLPNTDRIVPSSAFINISIIPVQTGILQEYITYSINILSTRGHWKKIDLTSDLTQILSHRKPLSNIFLSSNTSEVTVNRDDANLAFMPYIDIVTYTRKRRSKRSLTPAECIGPSRHLHCCSYELFIPFSLLSWDFIVYPSGVDARFCSGKCDYAHLRNNLRGKMIGYATGLTDTQTSSCCVPTKQESIKVLYRDASDGHIKFNTIEAFKIVDCGCA